jgi:tetratricopeptide (TPR) repeat protein
VTAEQGTPAGQPVQVRLLGPFSVAAAGRTAGPWPRPSARRLCGLVLVSPGRRVSRDLMLDGRADLDALRGQYDLALATLDAARPVLEARGTSARKCSFYHVLALGRVARNRFRVDETDVANMRASAAAAAQGDDDKDLGYATYFVGWLLWLHGDLAAAHEELERSLALAERIGEAILLGESLLKLALTALRRHDAEAVRSFARRAMAAHLDTGQVAEAVAAGRQLLHPAQQRLPDELESAVTAACLAWDQGEREAGGKTLTAALALARDLRYI